MVVITFKYTKNILNYVTENCLNYVKLCFLSFLILKSKYSMLTRLVHLKDFCLNLHLLLPEYAYVETTNTNWLLLCSNTQNIS